VCARAGLRRHRRCQPRCSPRPVRYIRSDPVSAPLTRGIRRRVGFVWRRVGSTSARAASSAALSGYRLGLMTSLPPNTEAPLTHGRLLARNAVWNVLGTGTPLFVAAFCIPVLIRALGEDRFGVLALAWALIGYASLFDFGLGRALTQLVSTKLAAGDY